MKKKTFGLITSTKSSYSHLRLMAEGKALKLNPMVFNVRELILASDFKKPCDFVINRSTGLAFDDLDLAILRNFEQRNIKSLNSGHSFDCLRNKDRQITELKMQGLNPPPSLFLRGPINSDELALQIKSWHGNSNFEKNVFILKTQRGNKGIGVNILRGFDSLKALLETLWGMGDQRFILQPYIPHKKEYRLFTIKGLEPVLIEKSHGDDFRANAERSKTTWIKNLNQKKYQAMLEASHLAFKKFDLHYAGLDFFQGNDGDLFLCEINPVPGFENIEKLTGRNIARELLSY